MRAPITDLAAIREFLLAGKAILTLVSKRSGARFTYRIKASKDRAVFFVGVLTGPENENHYSYLGIIKGGQYSHGRKSKIHPMKPCNVGFEWFVRTLSDDTRALKMLEQTEVWHEGKCCRCGRTLTVPESIASGIGPECAKRHVNRSGELQQELRL